MQSSDPSIESLVANLRDQVNDAFPKFCTACDKEYATLDVFMAATEPAVTLLDPDAPESSRATFERVCACGQDIILLIEERRSTSEVALKRRDMFGHLLTLLTDGGMPADTAKTEILKVMRGENSDLLTNEQLQQLFAS